MFHVKHPGLDGTSIRDAIGNRRADSRGLSQWPGEPRNNFRSAMFHVKHFLLPTSRLFNNRRFSRASETASR